MHVYIVVLQYVFFLFPASPNPRTAAVYYFIVAIVVLLIAFDAYFVLPLTVS